MINNFKRTILQFQVIVYSIWLFISIPAYSQWFQQESGTDTQLNSVFFLDSLNGWIVGNNSTILKTTNGGEEWTSLQSGFNNNFYDLCFTSDSVGFIVGGDGIDIYRTGIILRTSNAGQSWIQQCDSISRDLYAISFVNERVCYVSGGGPIYPGAGIILKTENAGISWDTVFFTNSPYGDNLYDIDFVDLNVGWAVGGSFFEIKSVIKKTTDGGKSWIDQNPPNSGVNSGCDFISEKEGWIVTSTLFYNSILYTEDGGLNWKSQTSLGSDFYARSIFFIDDKTGWCGYRKIYHTTDKGNAWIEQSHPIVSESFFTSIFFIDNNLGWIVGTDGIILKTTNGGVTFVEEDELKGSPTNYFLSNNYPNPFNPSTKIRYSVPFSSKVVIKVFDVLGNEIETLVNKEKPTGTYELTWYADGLPSGVYFYQLRTNEFGETKKMILIK